MMGPVQLKLTRLRVNAMRKMLSRPVVASALLSTLDVQLLGRVISKPPRKLAAKTTSMRKKRMLKKAFVERSFSAEAPKTVVMMSPRAT